VGGRLTVSERRLLYRGRQPRRRLALDTMCFLRHFEGASDWTRATRPLFSLVERGACTAVTSALTLTELLTAPLRQGEEALADEYRRILATFPHLSVVPIDAEVAEVAARLRGHYGLRTPDALHLATAVVSRADGFVSADGRLLRVTEVEVIPLREAS